MSGYMYMHNGHIRFEGGALPLLVHNKTYFAVVISDLILTKVEKKNSPVPHFNESPLYPVSTLITRVYPRCQTDGSMTMYDLIGLRLISLYSFA